jgi:hypothetical protein
MKPSALTTIALAFCTGACAKVTGSGTGQTQASSPVGRSVWKGDESLVSMLSKKQDSNVLRLAQQSAAQKAIEEEAASRRVPQSMYRTTEPPLPEPDLSLPVSDVPRPTANPPPSSTPDPTPSESPQPGQ